LRKTLQEMRLKFGILLGDGHPVRMEDGKWQLYDDIRAEIYGHPNTMTEAEYRDRVEEACSFLEGKSREWLAELKELMQKAAESRNYEKAAEFRDLIRAIGTTTERTRKFTHASIIQQDSDAILGELGEAIGMKALPRSMECFDISHISGSFCVASMVRFENGKPDRKQYRRYKIKTFIGNDDFRAMCEVVGRRYLRLEREDRPFPDLVIIDGGVGQVAAALRAFLESGLEPPMLIGLAKRRETIIFSDGRKPLELPGNHRGRLLLQYIRDEAHRHANAYNAELRKRKLRESMLEDCPGLGEKKRDALLKHFGSLAKLRKAGEAEIMQVEGIGPKLAKGVRQFLKN
jgi:excinuclease ABC subunit C